MFVAELILQGDKLRNMMRYTILLGIVLLTSACVLQPSVVGYGPMTARGGYQEKEIEPGVWRVLARAGGEAGPGYARSMAEFRAAELLKDRGFSWVQTLEEQPRWELGEELEGGRRRVTREDMELTVRGAHDPSKPTDCRQARCYTFTPDLMMEQARTHLRFKRVSASRRR